ncbi:site-specific DNA-methyltransferase [Lonepinella koalarum]|uniref:site-specific DNA-methyltransferase n=1 Tax=Lonepinella koalarum TaxID=53417 RepID=UPI003F6DE6C9
MLHWANKDQYYTKSGENFSNYAFYLADDKRVQFRLVEADTNKDNRKDNEQKRLFVLSEQPIVETAENLVIPFEYKALGKNDKQADYIDQAVEQLKSHPFANAVWQELFRLAPTEKDAKRTLLKKYLQDYTTKNTADYFIHKNLGAFLTGELDFYIKNEVMNLDDIQTETAFAEIEQNLQLIKIFKQVAQEIIAFLAQLEDFQKKLWLKKKFVTAVHYLVTLDKLPDTLAETALKNEQQIKQWQTLFNVDASGENLQNLRQKAPHLVVDTSLFAADFQAAVLKQMDDLDRQTDGVLIHSDNFQALNLLQARYKEQVKCIYIDPPYNTSASEIIYKNGYKHSSWLSLIENRVSISKNLLMQSGIIEIAIDNMELRRLNMVLDEVLGENNFISNISVEHNAKGIPQEHISATNEFFLIYAKNIYDVETYDFKLNEQELSDKFPQIDDKGSYRELPLTRTGSDPLRKDRPFMFFPFLYKNNELSLLPDDERTQIYNSSTNKFNDIYLDELREKYESLGYEFILPKNSKGDYYRWKWGVESCKQGLIDGDLVYRNNTVYNKNRVDDKVKPKSLWCDAKYDATSKGTRVLGNLFGSKLFDYPKSIFLVQDAITIGADNNSLILDYFAGSGTTAHAVINLNREDGGKRHYILVEQGEYFDTVLKPRVQKVIFAENYKDGKPQADNSGSFNGVSQLVKILKLESYEDTLNNLELKKVATDLFSQKVQQDYLLHYMLDLESRDSLLNSDHFAKPFDYQLNITTTSAGAYAPQGIDLVETFNYLIGLKVAHIDDNRERGIVAVTGTMPNGEQAFILWRDCEKVGYAELNRYLESRSINPADSEYQVVYINGDHNVPTVFADNDDTVQTLKVRQIETEFLGRMFEM